MTDSTLWWLFINLITLIIMGFYSMVEFACVTFNRVRLQYYVKEGVRRAIWLDSLLKNPAKLFGTSLIGVNVLMMISSESARQFYASLGLPPEVAPITQVFIAITIGELAPMLAARRYPEQVSMLGMPLLYASSIVVRPVLFCIDILTRIVTWLVGAKDGKGGDIFLNRDELQKILEQPEESVSASSEDFNVIVSHIFSLRERSAEDIMEPINPVHMIPANSTVAHMKHILEKTHLPYLPVFHRSYSNVVGIAFPRDLIRISGQSSIRDHARPPWFLTKSAKILEIMTQFRRNNQSVAVVLNSKGKAVGILTLDAMLQEVFGTTEPKVTEKFDRLLERTIPGDMTIADFEEEFHATGALNKEETVSQLVTELIGHIPESGESAHVGPFRLTVKETALIGAKTITVTSWSQS